MESAETVKIQPTVKRPRAWRSIVLFLSIVGPGFITANLDNDAGGIGTYSQAGAQFGYGFLWLLIPVTVALIVVQEICVRLGVVTGKGLGDLIREKFGVRITLFVMSALVLTNLFTTVAEFGGVAASAEIFHIGRFVAVPVAVVVVALLALVFDYKWVEKIFISASFIYLTYIVSGILVHPDWHRVALATFVPTFSPTKAYLLMFLAVVGTTITPWMQFYIQSSVVEKGVKPKELVYSQVDVVSGCLMTDIVAYFIIVACGATLYLHHIYAITDASQAALALAPFGPRLAEILFAVGLLNASLFAGSVLPLSTAYTVCEALGFESGVGRKFREAPVFYSLYVALIVLGAGAVLFLHVPIFVVLVYSQVVSGILLPVIVVAMLFLVNDADLMGKYVNGKAWNAIAWLTAVVTIAATAALLVASLFGFS